MSTPNDPHGSGTPEPEGTAPEAGAQANTPADAQPTEAFSADGAPAAPSTPGATAAYPPVPPAPEAPAAAYAQAPSGQAPYGKAAYGQDPSAQAAYGQPPYGQAPYGTPAPTGPDTRPKTLAWTSLGLAIAGTLLACIGFIPLGWASLVVVLLGGVLLLAAFIVSIVAIASRKHGGKPIGISALIVSVIGSIVWAVAFFVALAFGIVTSAISSDPTPGPEFSDSIEDGTDDGADVDGDTDTDASASGEQAFLAEVRPELVALFSEIDPNVDESLVNQTFSDEALLALGEAFLFVGDEGRDQMIQGMIEGSDGAFDAESAGRFADIIIDAAEKHLQ